MATNNELAGQLAELLFNKIATPVQIADASKNLRDAYRPDLTSSIDQQQIISLLNQTAGSAGMISAATGYAEIYAAYALSGGKVVSILGKTTIGFGAVSGGANVLLYQQELQKVSGDYSKVATSTTLNAAAGILSGGAVVAFLLAAPVALTLLTVGAVGLTAASLISGSDTVETTLDKLKGLLGDNPTEDQKTQLIQTIESILSANSNTFSVPVIDGSGNVIGFSLQAPLSINDLGNGISRYQFADGTFLDKSNGTSYYDPVTGVTTIYAHTWDNKWNLPVGDSDTLVITEKATGEYSITRQSISGPNLTMSTTPNTNGDWGYTSKIDLDGTVIAKRVGAEINGQKVEATFGLNEQTGQMEILSVDAIDGKAPSDSEALVNFLRGEGVTDTTFATQGDAELAAKIGEAISAYNSNNNSALQNLVNGVATYGPSIIDALSLIKAIQNGEPLPILASGLRLANDLSNLNGVSNLNLSGAANAASGILSLMNLDAALEQGDTLGAITAGAQAIAFGAQAFSDFATAQAFNAIEAGGMNLAAETAALQGQAFANTVGKALPVLSLIGAIRSGDPAGIVVSTLGVLNSFGAFAVGGIFASTALAAAVPVIGWIYAVYSILDSLFNSEEIPDPWGTGQFLWNGTGITYQTVGETGGAEAVTNVMTTVLSTLNALIERVQQQNPGSQLGLIPQRMPSMGYDMSGYRYTDIDPLTGAEKNPALRFDTSGNPYNAEPGSPESFQSIVEGMVYSALGRQAIAPLWEVLTARAQTDAGDPKAGLTEEERAGRDGRLAPPITGTTQTFRPVMLDLDGDGIETLGKSASGVAFDVDDSGFMKQTGWATGGDAFLTLDRDYNGQTNSGREMFSNSVIDISRRGLAGMAWVDSNYDGKLTAADPVWNDLKVWIDDGDGVDEAGEKLTLAGLGITELNYSMGTFTQNGQVKQLASPDLEADKDGTRVSIVPEGILVQRSVDNKISLLVTRIDDLTLLEANRDGVTSYEDVETIISGADLLANDTLGGFSGSNLTITGLTNFRQGTGFIDANGFVHFIPQANYSGTDAGFDYTVLAANGQTGTAGVNINLQNVNDAPTLDYVERNTRPVYGSLPIIPQYSGITGGELIYEPFTVTTISGNDDYGTVTFIYTIGSRVVQYSNLWSGEGSTYTYFDGEAFQPITNITSAGTYSEPIVQEDTGVGRVVGSDVDNPVTSLSYEIVNLPQYGGLTLNPDGTFQYTSWKEPGVPSDRIVVDGQYAGFKDGTLYTQSNLPSNAVYPTTDIFQVKITDPSGASTIQNISVPHLGPYLPPTPPGGGGKKPIAIDLNGNGFEFINVNDSNVFFDVNGDGWKRRTAWVAPGDGLLAYDVDGDGKIDKSGEISFAQYKNGAQSDLEGLSAFDTNGDGRFTAADEKWASFGVWQDSNQNGITDAGEFKSLNEMGITAVELTSDGQFSVINGQTVQGVGSVEKADGSRMAIADVTLEYSSETLVPQADGSTVSVTPPSPFSPNGEVLEGTDDKDLILGKNGNNIVKAYAGDDVIFEDGGNDIIEAGDGNDIVYAGADNDLVMAGNGDDTVYAGLGSDVVFGGEGNDAILAEGGNDIVFGGAGNDLIAGGWGNDVLSGDDGDDQVYGESGNDALFGRDGNDELAGMDGYDLLNGGLGNDLLDGGAGDDEMTGGAGDDTYIVDSAADTVIELADEGRDTVKSAITYVLGDQLENLNLVGGALQGTGNAQANVLIGNGAANVLIGMDGNDRLNGGLGADTLIGGIGDDTYIVDNAGDVVVEQLNEGMDTVLSSVSYGLSANVENLTLTGLNDTSATGNDLANTLIGNIGNNLLDGGAGADAMAGGLGNDSYIVDNLADTVTEMTGAGIDTVYSSVSFVLPEHVENLVLTGNAVVDGTGNTLDNLIIGNDAANMLSGGEGNDQLYGNGGNDLLNGGIGADYMVGGLGDDLYYVDNANDVVEESANGGYDTVRTSISLTAPTQVERVELLGTDNLNATGNELDNVLIGNSGANQLDGGLGIDTMTGGAGDDVYIVDNAADTVLETAGEGNDLVRASVTTTLSDQVEQLTLTGTANINAVGNALDNILVGNTGNNTLDGVAGADTMAGGAGDDRYIVDNAGDIVFESMNAGVDVIYSLVSYVLPENVENLYLIGNASINGVGNSADNWLVGNNSDNILSGDGGNDRLTAAGGNDTLEGGNGNDALTGGIGNDTYVINKGDGWDQIDDVAGQDTVRFGAGLTLENVALRVTQGNGGYMANVRVLDSEGCEQQGEGFDFAISIDANGRYVSPIETFQFADGSSKSLDDLLIKTVTTIGTSKTTQIITGRNDDIIYGGSKSNTIISGSGNDVVFAGSGGDSVFGEGGYDFLQGGIGNDILEGGCGVDVLAGSMGQDFLRDLDGNNAMFGGFQNDRIETGSANDFIAGGKNDDLISAGGGYNVIAFNKGDGRDTVMSSVGASNTLSLGVGIDESSLSLLRTGQDLILEMGGSSQLTFKDWYASAANQNIVTLQMIEEQPASISESGWNIEQYDFQALVQAFDTAKAADAKLSSWNLMNSMLDAHLETSDAMAIGGELAARYASGGDKAVSLGTAQTTLQDAQFGSQTQSVGSRFNATVDTYQIA